MDAAFVAVLLAEIFARAMPNIESLPRAQTCRPSCWRNWRVCSGPRRQRQALMPCGFTSPSWPGARQHTDHLGLGCFRKKQ